MAQPDLLFWQGEMSNPYLLSKGGRCTDRVSVQMPGYRCLVMDNRGVGNSDTPSGRYSTSEMAKDVLDLLNYLEWTLPRSLHVIGVSMGGCVRDHGHEMQLTFMDIIFAG